MATTSITGRLHYLHGAAQYLSAKAPTTAAILEAEHTRLLTEQDLSPQAGRRIEVCGACGSIMTPGKSCQVELVSCGPRKRITETNEKTSVLGLRSRNTTAMTSGGVFVYTCNRCRRRTRHVIQANMRSTNLHGSKTDSSLSGPNPSPKANAIDLAETITRPIIEKVEESPATASDIVRKKARAKRQSGLLAMLDKAKKEASTASSRDFGLMDFMKSQP